MTLIAHAVRYGQLGFEVFPVNPRTKRPLTSQKTASTERKQIIRWWKQFPDALIGHRLAENIIILDVDPRHNGHETWLKLRQMELSQGFVTRVHYSGRDVDGTLGGHWWFKRPDGELAIGALDDWSKEHGTGVETGDRWNSGIDLLTRNHRYTILPPSKHPTNGKPYWWAKGRGLEIQPDELPPEIAKLLVDQRPARLQKVVTNEPQWRDPDSIADWFSDTHTFHDILTQHSWELVSGDGDEDGSSWRHPKATNELSATVRNDCLFVHSTSTSFEPTTPGRPRGYTRFASWAVLAHGGDLSAAARAARALKRDRERHDPPRAPRALTSAPEPAAGDDDEEPEREIDIDPAFWQQRRYLQHIRDFARARMVAPYALLGVMMARVAAATPPSAVLPPLIGSHLSLNTFVVLIGSSGSGKDAAINAGRDCMDISAGIEFRQIGLGSGEGLLDQYVKFTPPKDEDPGGVDQFNESVLFVNPEIETLKALKSRTSSTLLPELRNAWVGSQLGFAYATKERRLYVTAHKYRMCLILGAQPEHADVLLDDHAAGTPQRFLWLPVADPVAPDEPPPEPEPLEWHLPHWGISTNGRKPLTVCDDCSSAIKDARLNRLRDPSDDGSSGHALALREKAAAIFAIMDRRAHVDDDDWHLAGELMRVSDGVRDGLKRRMERTEAQKIESAGRKDDQRVAAQDRSKTERVTRKLLRRLKERGGWVSENDARKNLIASRDRDVFEYAIENLVSTGLVEYRHGQGRMGKERIEYKAKQ